MHVQVRVIIVILHTPAIALKSLLTFLLLKQIFKDGVVSSTKAAKYKHHSFTHIHTHTCTHIYVLSQKEFRIF